MKKFEKIFFKFLFNVILVLTILWSINLCFVDFYDGKTKNDLVIVGNSHSEVSIIPDSLMEVFPKVINRSKSGRSLFFIVKGIKTHGFADNIMIEFTNNSLTTDWWTFDDKRMLRERCVALNFNYEDWIYLIKKNFGKTIRLILTCPMFWEKQTGDYVINKRNRLKDDLLDNGKRIKVQHFKINNEELCQLKGFFELSKFISENQHLKNILIVRSPMNPYYFKTLESNEDLYLKFLFELKKYSNVRILDYGKFKLDESCFADLDHLNLKGAKFFSVILRDSLKKLLIIK
jgi:hypothetical protein